MQERIIEGTPLQETMANMDLEDFSDEENDGLVDVVQEMEKLSTTGKLKELQPP